MAPRAIVKQAKAVGLDMIAICDHNSVENVQAVIKAGKRESVRVIPGIEITSREEVHVVGLFNSDKNAKRVQATVYENLPGTNDEAAFGPQTIVDEWDRAIGNSDKLLIGATNMPLEGVVRAIHDCDGLAVAAHVDRQRFGIIGHLGFIPEGLKLDALEVSARASITDKSDFPVVTSSDAHCLADIGRGSTTVIAEQANVEEICKALGEEDGRRVFANMQDLSLHILDIVENSIAAAAGKVSIAINENTDTDSLSLAIRDNGKGMDPEACKRALDPFFTTRTTRRVGLGLSLLAQAARQAGGKFEIVSETGLGTTVTAVFQLSHPDMKPIGDIGATLRTILTGRPELDLRFEYKKDSKLIAEFGGD